MIFVIYSTISNVMTDFLKELKSFPTALINFMIGIAILVILFGERVYYALDNVLPLFIISVLAILVLKGIWDLLTRIRN